MNIAVVGIGYVGLAMAVLLSQRHHVTAVDIDAARVDKLSRRPAPIQDADIEAYISGCELDLTATLDAAAAYRQADWVVISTPTNYDPHVMVYLPCQQPVVQVLVHFKKEIGLTAVDD